ncbi:hypothetical protein BC834DRAFT_847422 [Gloeopeniophorella convolvens]|nr:hypothetical protein BC834DRAFT_847422 [Gloeopeniophorella convolvens]
MWMGIAQTSRHWRTVAATSQIIWSYIPLEASIYWAGVSLKLSHSTLISFCVDLSSAYSDWYRRAVLDALRAIPRTREIHLLKGPRVDPELDREVFRLLAASPAPALDTLTIWSTAARNTVTLSDDIFLRRVPSALRSLTLKYCDLSVTSPLLQTRLTSLVLEDCDIDTPLEVIRHLSDLRSLTLRRIRKTFSRRTSSPVRLPRLQDLAVEDTSEIVTSLLQSIQISASTSISLTCDDYMEIEEDLTDVQILHLIASTLSPVISTHLERAFAKGYSFPSLEIPASPRVDILSFNLSGDPAPSPHALSPYFRLSFPWASPGPDLFLRLLSALPHAVLQHVYTLRLRARAADARSRRMDEAARGLIALVEEAPLPALRSVVLEGVSFRLIDQDMPKDVAPYRDALARALVHRRQTQVREKTRLAIWNCAISRAEVVSLRDCLGLDVVDWDGVTEAG